MRRHIHTRSCAPTYLHPLLSLHLIIVSHFIWWLNQTVCRWAVQDWLPSTSLYTTWLVFSKDTHTVHQISAGDFCSKLYHLAPFPPFSLLHHPHLQLLNFLPQKAHTPIILDQIAKAGCVLYTEALIRLRSDRYSTAREIRRPSAEMRGKWKVLLPL